MREVINISLPKGLARTVEKMVKDGQFATKSEFVRELIRERAAEMHLLARIEKSRKEMQSGKGKLLNSLSDIR